MKVFPVIILTSVIFLSGCKRTTEPEMGNQYPLHENITATVFWVGEESGPENGYIPNNESAWDDNWQGHYGGVDDPSNRNGYLPAKFIPKENPFYFALPYNDFDAHGRRKASAAQMIYWAKEKSWGELESMCKNQWIKISFGDKTVFAQWEDVGPFNSDDAKYVFGTAPPENKENNNAGLDVSPAVRDYLGLNGMDKVNWQFVKEKDVPEGEWKKIISTSQIYWK
jgi:hypothetical protein